MDKQKIQDLMNDARRNKNLRALAAYRTVLSSIQEREAKENKDLMEDQVFKVIQTEMKLYDETADAFGDRPEADAYRKSSKLLKELLPTKLDESYYPEIVSQTISESGYSNLKDMGKVMTEIKNKYGISVDMKKISSMVRERLTQ